MSGSSRSRRPKSSPRAAHRLGELQLAIMRVLWQESEATAARVSEWFRSEQLRVYTNPDIAGVQLGGAIKNVMAIATGIADGLSLGANARAALVTRGLAELTRLGTSLTTRQLLHLQRLVSWWSLLADISFADLLLLPGVGRRTVEALALVAEILHGTPCRFTDPARFSLALGGKDGHPFPVPLRVYDQMLTVLRRAIDGARLGNDDRLAALRRLDRQSRLLEAAARGPELEELVDLVVGDDERGREHHRISDRPHHEPVLEAVIAAQRADVSLGLEERSLCLVLDELQRSEQAHQEDHGRDARTHELEPVEERPAALELPDGCDRLGLHRAPSSVIATRADRARSLRGRARR